MTIRCQLCQTFTVGTEIPNGPNGNVENICEKGIGTGMHVQGVGHAAHIVDAVILRNTLLLLILQRILTM